jgi:hypothetical protein
MKRAGGHGQVWEVLICMLDKGWTYRWLIPSQHWWRSPCCSHKAKQISSFLLPVEVCHFGRHHGRREVNSWLLLMVSKTRIWFSQSGLVTLEWLALRKKASLKISKKLWDLMEDFEMK